jgi:hypothetical protein
VQSGRIGLGTRQQHDAGKQRAELQEVAAAGQAPALTALRNVGVEVEALQLDSNVVFARRLGDEGDPIGARHRSKLPAVSAGEPKSVDGGCPRGVKRYWWIGVKRH